MSHPKSRYLKSAEHQLPDLGLYMPHSTKRSRLPWRNSQSRKIQNNLGKIQNIKVTAPKSKEGLKKWQTLVKGTEKSAYRSPTDQCWFSLRIKVNNDSI